MRKAVEWMSDRQKVYADKTSILWQFEAQFWNGEVERTINEVEIEQGVPLNLVKKETPRINKFTRIVSGLYPKYQNGRIYYNEDLKPNMDCQTGTDQLISIEAGSTEKDDSPDADHQAIDSLEKYNEQPRQTNEGHKSWMSGRAKQTYKF